MEEKMLWIPFLTILQKKKQFRAIKRKKKIVDTHYEQV